MRCLRWGVLSGTHISSIDRHSRPCRGSGWAFYSRMIDPAVVPHPTAAAHRSGDRQLIGLPAGITPKYRHVIAMDFVPLRSHWIHGYGIKRDRY